MKQCLRETNLQTQLKIVESKTKSFTHHTERGNLLLHSSLNYRSKTRKTLQSWTQPSSCMVPEKNRKSPFNDFGCTTSSSNTFPTFLGENFCVFSSITRRLAAAKRESPRISRCYKFQAMTINFNAERSKAHPSFRLPYLLLAVVVLTRITWRGIQVTSYITSMCLFLAWTSSTDSPLV